MQKIFNLGTLEKTIYFKQKSIKKPETLNNIYIYKNQP